MGLAPVLLTIANIINPVTADSLRHYLWQARPILIFAAEDDPRLAQQLALFQDASAALHDRDNVVVVDPGGDTPLGLRFRPDGFTVILVGLDGGEKLRRQEVIDPRTLNALIDTMPMRQQELQQRSD